MEPHKVLAMAIRTTPRPLCPLCGNAGNVLYPDLQDRMFAVPGTWSLKQCNNQNCCFCWLDPTPVAEDLHLLYQAYYTHETSEPGKNPTAKFRAFFYSAYMAAAYVPSTILGLTKARKDILHMYLHDSRPGKLLDVGCGSGIFLHQMYKLGWSATGLDFDPKAIENARLKYGTDLTVMHTDLPGAKFPDNSFDAVTMNHVIEHVSDPIGLLGEARRVLKTGGKLIAATPNIQSFGHSKFHDLWRGLEPPRHLQIFSLASLRECARQAGFDRVRVISTAANADTIIGGSFGFAEAKATGDCSSGGRVQINFVRGLRSLLLQYREALQMRRDPECGEELVLICEK
ncbi:MAG: class I SAM-dependent methyltransferase [Limisphaerales bacterium]